MKEEESVLEKRLTKTQISMKVFLHAELDMARIYTENFLLGIVKMPTVLDLLGHLHI